MNELIESHIGFAHAIAAELAGKYPPYITRADLERAAEFGLVQAARNYEPARSVSFATFAYYRVRGAIIDEVRKSWNASHLKTGSDKPAMEESASASPADEAFTTRSEYDQYTASGVDSGFVSLDNSYSDWVPATTESPASHVLRKEESEAIQKAIRRLPHRHRLVLHAYYFEDLSLVNIGRQLNLSKSWVSRIHAQALAKLRTILPESMRPATSARSYRSAAIPLQATLVMK